MLASPHTAAPPSRLVIDDPIRMFHWLFAASFLGAYLSAESEHWRVLHITLGYTMLGLLGFRVIYGLIGPGQVRLGLLWRKVSHWSAWWQALPRQAWTAAHWTQGQNLLMGSLVVLLMLWVIPTALTGYAHFNEWDGGLELFEELHEFFGNAYLVLVGLHLGAVLVLSVLRRKNQAQAILTGRIRGAGPDLVKHRHRWLAWLLLAAAVGFAIWQAQWVPR